MFVRMDMVEQPTIFPYCRTRVALVRTLTHLLTNAFANARLDQCAVTLNPETATTSWAACSFKLCAAAALCSTNAAFCWVT